MKAFVQLAVASFSLLASGMAYSDGGRIIVANGNSTIEREGKLYRAVKNSRLIPGDKVSTARGAKLQWALEDDSLYTMGSGSQMVIDKIHLNRAANNSSRALGQLALRLLRGGFRTISGLIGTRNFSAYNISTPNATMGIRGTDYTTYFIDAAQAQKLGIDAGTYLKVDKGSVEITSAGESLVVVKGQIAFSAIGAAPVRIDLLPDVLADQLGGDDLEFRIDFFESLGVQITEEPDLPASPS